MYELVDEYDKKVDHVHSEHLKTAHEDECIESGEDDDTQMTEHAEVREDREDQEYKYESANENACTKNIANEK